MYASNFEIDIKKPFAGVVIEEEVEEEKEEEKPTKIVEKVDENEIFMSGSISQISALGKLTVEFDEILKNITYEDLNSSLIDIYIEEAADRMVGNINLTWKLEGIKSNNIIFQLDFEDTSGISPIDI